MERFIVIMIFVLLFAGAVIADAAGVCNVGCFNGDELQKDVSYDVEQMNITFESSGYTLYGEIYYPLNVSGKCPGVVFCEGYPGYVSAYSWIPEALAEKGYVVLIYDPPGLGESEGFLPKWYISLSFLNLYFRFGCFIETPFHYVMGEWVFAASDALTYLLMDSPVNHLIDNTSVGLIGHSLGGITVTQTAVQDKRFNAVVVLSHGDPFVVDNISVPIQFQRGSFDIPTHSVPIVLACYRKANTPKELIMIECGTHWGFTTAWGSLCPCPPWQREIILRYTIGWFNYFLKNKQEAYETITTGAAHLSKVVKSRYNFGEEDHFIE